MNKPLARFFYEECCGTTAGHMANIPNNPILYTLIASCTGRSSQGGEFAATQSEFASLLQGIAEVFLPECDTGIDTSEAVKLNKAIKALEEIAHCGNVSADMLRIHAGDALDEL